MPLYEYLCGACDRRFEVIHNRFSDPPVEICKLCGKGPVQRLPSSPAIQFKGSGWYITDYAKKGSGDSAAGKKDAPGGGDAKGGDAKAGGDAKSEGGAKSETASKSESSSSPTTTPTTTSKE